jgi:hypothetical protein
MKRVVLISIALGMFAVSAGTAAAQAPTWNSGYNGWARGRPEDPDDL